MSTRHAYKTHIRAHACTHRIAYFTSPTASYISKSPISALDPSALDFPSFSRSGTTSSPSDAPLWCIKDRRGTLYLLQISSISCTIMSSTNSGLLKIFSLVTMSLERRIFSWVSLKCSKLVSRLNFNAKIVSIYREKRKR